MGIFSWLSSTRIEVDTAYPSIEWQYDKALFCSMLDGTIGMPFKRKGYQSVYQIETSVGLCYLKRTSYQAPRSILRHLLRGRRAHTDSGWEYLAVRALQKHGFRVMQPVAFGEQYWLGLWPRRAFLLARAVPGIELVDIMSGHANSALRREAFGALGYYMGRLHGSGFFHQARVHDFILDSEEEAQESEPRLTMIDLDFKGLLPVPRAFDANIVMNALALSCYRFLRVGHRATRAELSKFVRRYRSGLRSFGHDLPRKHLHVLSRVVTQRLNMLAADPALCSMFPAAPTSLEDAFR